MHQHTTIAHNYTSFITFHVHPPLFQMSPALLFFITPNFYLPSFIILHDYQPILSQCINFNNFTSFPKFSPKNPNSRNLRTMH